MRTLICQKCGESFETNTSFVKFCPNCRPQKKGAFKYQRDPKNYDQCPLCGEKKSRSAQQCRACAGKSKRYDKNPQWKGGRAKMQDGYIQVTLPNGKRAMEHRLVLEQKLGRPLKANELGHHLNGIRDDNRPENLVATVPGKHPNNTLIPLLQARIRELEQLHLPI